MMMNTIIELSRYSMTFGFVVAIYILIAIGIGLKKKDKRYIESGYRGTVSYMLLLYIFLFRHDSCFCK